jgi:ComF family protein
MLFHNLNQLLFPDSCLVCKKPLPDHSASHTSMSLETVCQECFPDASSFSLFESRVRCSSCYFPLTDCCFNREKSIDDPPCYQSKRAEVKEEYYCQFCIYYKPLIKRARYLLEYDEKVKHIIHIMKYAPRIRLARDLGQLLRDALPLLFASKDEPYTNKDFLWDYVIPIPSTKSSLQKRLFNQCNVMAKEITKDKFLKKSYTHSLLLHSKKIPSQTSQKVDQRLKNVQECFRVKRSAVCGTKILLVDDVCTTGSTSSAAALALLEAGAKSIDALYLARKTETWIQYRYKVWYAFKSKKLLQSII